MQKIDPAAGAIDPTIAMRWAGWIGGIVFIIFITIMALKVPNPTGFQEFVFRVPMSVGAAAFASFVPGFLVVQALVKEKSKQAGICGGGAIVVFLLLMYVNPTRLGTPAANAIGTKATFSLKVADKAGPISSSKVTVTDADTTITCQRKHGDPDDQYMIFDGPPSMQRVRISVDAEGYQPFDKTVPITESPYRAVLDAKLVTPKVRVFKKGEKGDEMDLHDGVDVNIAGQQLTYDSEKKIFTGTILRKRLAAERVTLIVSGNGYQPQSREIEVNFLELDELQTVCLTAVSVQPAVVDPPVVQPTHVDPPVVVVPPPTVYLLLYREHFNGGSFWEVQHTDMNNAGASNGEFRSWSVPFNPNAYNIKHQEEVAGDERFKGVQGPNWWTKPPFNLPGLRQEWLHRMDDERWYFVEATRR